MRVLYVDDEPNLLEYLFNQNHNEVGLIFDTFETLKVLVLTNKKDWWIGEEDKRMNVKNRFFVNCSVSPTESEASVMWVKDELDQKTRDTIVNVFTNYKSNFLESLKLT
jgi:hypothetical protein